MLLKFKEEKPGVVGLLISFIPEILIVLAIIGAVVGKRAFDDEYMPTIFAKNFFEKELQKAQLTVKTASDNGQPTPEIKSIKIMVSIMQGPIAKKLELKQPIDAEDAKLFLLSFNDVYSTKEQVVKTKRQVEEMGKNNPDKLIELAEETYSNLKKVYESNKAFFLSQSLKD